MRYFDGLTANMLRTGPDGLSYYAPAGKLGPLYLVPDEKAVTRMRREWRYFFIAFFAAIPVAILTVGTARLASAGWKLYVFAVLFGGLAGVLYGLLVARGLPRASISFAQLAPLSRAEGQAAAGMAMGRRTLRLLFGSSLFMTILGAIAVAASPTVTLGISVAFFAYCSFVLYKMLQRTP
jgi:hypothetical protein